MTVVYQSGQTHSVTFNLLQVNALIKTVLFALRDKARGPNKDLEINEKENNWPKLSTAD